MGPGLPGEVCRLCSVVGVLFVVAASFILAPVEAVAEQKLAWEGVATRVPPSAPVPDTVQDALTHELAVFFDETPPGGVIEFLTQISGVSMVYLGQVRPPAAVRFPGMGSRPPSSVPFGFGPPDGLAVSLSGEGALAGWLDGMCNQLDLAWTVKENVVVVGRADTLRQPPPRVRPIPPDAEAALERTTPISFAETPLTLVAEFLTMQTGTVVTCTSEGELAAMDVVTLGVETRLANALDLICMETGNVWGVREGGIAIGRPLDFGLLPAASGASAALKESLFQAGSVNMQDVALEQVLVELIGAVAPGPGQRAGDLPVEVRAVRFAGVAPRWGLLDLAATLAGSEWAAVGDTIRLRPSASRRRGVVTGAGPSEIPDAALRQPVDLSLSKEEGSPTVRLEVSGFAEERGLRVAWGQIGGSWSSALTEPRRLTVVWDTSPFGSASVDVHVEMPLEAAAEAAAALLGTTWGVSDGVLTIGKVAGPEREEPLGGFRPRLRG